MVLDHCHCSSLTHDMQQYVISCGCRKRIRPSSRRVTMLPGRPLEQWDELQIGILKYTCLLFPVTSLFYWGQIGSPSSGSGSS